MSSNLETRSLLDEWRDFDKGGFFDFGHPLLNRIAESFVKAAGIGAIKAVTREACLIAVEGMCTFFSSSYRLFFILVWFNSFSSGIYWVIDISMWDCFAPGTESSNSPDITGAKNKKHPFPDLRGETNRKSLEAMASPFPIVNFQNGLEGEEHWERISTMGLSAGLYSGLTYGLKEALGAHDWKNSAVAGAITGMALALTCEKLPTSRLCNVPSPKLLFRLLQIF
ncbi:hypothetical protein CRYUN_Cryun18bG0008000 [Craigia yunnanensis]